MCLQIGAVGADARCQSACVFVESCAAPDPRYGAPTLWSVDADGATPRADRRQLPRDAATRASTSARACMVESPPMPAW